MKWSLQDATEAKETNNALRDSIKYARKSSRFGMLGAIMTKQGTKQKKKNLVTIAVTRFYLVDDTGLEPVTPCTSSKIENPGHIESGVFSMCPEFFATDKHGSNIGIVVFCRTTN